MHIVECPRDAMQGIHDFIPTDLKIEYLNALLRVGFDTLDFGSFVSPTAIPQLRDTHEVLQSLEWETSPTKLLAIVANRRGAEEACSHTPISYIGYPFSLSETFQLRNTHKTIAESLVLVQEMQQLCVGTGKELVVYLSMGFGNPYGDTWSPEGVADWAEQLAAMGIRTLALADTVGVATPATISALFQHLMAKLPEVSFGAHFHSTPQTRHEKIAAAYDAGCRRFDVALHGYGGCPFADDELVGNLSTESLFDFLAERNAAPTLNLTAFQQASILANTVFSGRH